MITSFAPPLPEPSPGSRCSRISSMTVWHASASPSVTGAECRLDVPVTKLSTLSDGQIRHVETGTHPRLVEASRPANTYKYANERQNKHHPANEPSITDPFLSSSALARQHQSATPSNGVIERRPPAVLTPPPRPLPPYIIHKLSAFHRPLFAIFHVHFLQFPPLTFISSLSNTSSILC